jgi:hypothetical protein
MSLHLKIGNYCHQAHSTRPAPKIVEPGRSQWGARATSKAADDRPGDTRRGACHCNGFFLALPITPRGGWCDSCANHSRPSLRPVRSPSRHLRRQCRPNERLLHYERLCRTRQPRGVAEVNRLIKTDFSEQYCVRHSGSAKMSLLFILFGWLGLGCCRCPQVLSRYSRFSRFNSRLGRQKFPVRQATGSGSQSLDIAGCFGDQAAALRGKSEKFAVSSRMDGNFSLPQEGLMTRIPARRRGSTCRPTSPTFSWRCWQARARARSSSAAWWVYTPRHFRTGRGHGRRSESSLLLGRSGTVARRVWTIAVPACRG